jgi:hypothetical protein
VSEKKSDFQEKYVNIKFSEFVTNVLVLRNFLDRTKPWAEVLRSKLKFRLAPIILNKRSIYFTYLGWLKIEIVKTLL